MYIYMYMHKRMSKYSLFPPQKLHLLVVKRVRGPAGVS